MVEKNTMAGMMDLVGYWDHLVRSLEGMAFHNSTPYLTKWCSRDEKSHIDGHGEEHDVFFH